MSSLYPTDPKVFSNVEMPGEVDADERMKQKEASRRDTQAANRSSSRKKKATAKTTQADDDDDDDEDGKRKRGRPRKDKSEDKKSSNKKRGRKDGGGASTTKKSIKRLRQQRRIQQSKDAKKAEEEEARKRERKAELNIDYHPGNIIAEAPVEDPGGSAAAAPEDFFWEVERVIGRRIRRGRAEYLIRWKGCSENDNTWEPAANLCDTASEYIDTIFGLWLFHLLCCVYS